MDEISPNFNYQTIKQIHHTVKMVLGGADWLTKKQLFAGLAFADIPIADSQLCKDIALLRECNIPDFNYFKGDKGFDKKSATIIIIFRWFARNRSRGQGIVHLPEVLKLIGEIDKNDKQQWCNCRTIEVQAIPV